MIKYLYIVRHGDPLTRRPTNRIPKFSFANSAALCLTLLLTACGGGGGGSAPRVAITPGLYSGRTDTGTDVLMAMKPDGTFWATFSPSEGSDATILLFVNGIGQSDGVAWRSSQASAYQLPGNPLPVGGGSPKLSGPYTADKFQATFAFEGGSSSFTLSYAPTDAPAPLKGSFSGPAAIFIDQAPASFIQPSVTFTVDTNGGVLGTLTRPSGTPGQPDATASLTGKLTPRPEMAAYDLSLTIRSSDPTLAGLFGSNGSTSTGLAMFEPGSGTLAFALAPSSGPAIAGKLAGPS